MMKSLSPSASLPCPLPTGLMLQTLPSQAVELGGVQSLVCGLEQPALVLTTPPALQDGPRVAMYKKIITWKVCIYVPFAR